MDFQEIRKGKFVDIFAFQIEKGNCPCKKFISILSKDENKKLKAFFERFDSRAGIWKNKEKVRKLENFKCQDCYELKPTAQIRISFVYLKLENTKKKLCLLDGFKKKSDKWPKNKIDTTQKRCNNVQKLCDNRF